MKTAVAKTKNVLAAFDAYQHLSEAALNNTPSIAMFTGEAGLGKTTAGSYLFVQADGILVRCLKSDTLGTFLERLAQELGLEQRQRKADMLKFIVHELAITGKPLFIDECDYIAERQDVLETIRDIYDLANVPIILIGYKQLPKKVKRLEQLYSRISQHIEFQPADLDDITTMASELVTDTAIHADLLAELLQASKGNFRRIHTGLNTIEAFARSNAMASINATQWGGLQFFPSVN
ncbi:ATP-binding protein [Arsukibacterium sp.]|uniref:ATP-binding protein n=1 Tax=Arsukibacterium sp. TaxID=1977258 RepID=UPI00299F05AC|nr:ATP-binding protein [Arsukibacterium sp.]MDX1536368.1 ATP-binding protein [Arsukibacterium sp.]